MLHAGLPANGASAGRATCETWHRSLTPIAGRHGARSVSGLARRTIGGGCVADSSACVVRAQTPRSAGAPRLSDEGRPDRADPGTRHSGADPRRIASRHPPVQRVPNAYPPTQRHGRLLAETGTAAPQALDPAANRRDLRSSGQARHLAHRFASIQPLT